MTLPSLVAVVPAYNEAASLERTLRLLRASLEASPWSGSRIVVVDDGSTDESPQLLARLAEELGLVVVSQPNSGRLAARLAGLRHGHEELALLVDARVAVDPGALAYVAGEIAQDAAACIWNGDVTVVTRGNPFAGFWSALTVLGWRRYFADRRRMSYGLDEFDLYPKGTTLFLAPRAELVQESEGLSTHFTVRRFSSDDTALIRGLAARHSINLSPDFSCTYAGRESLVPFLKHATFRGTTFVDSYIGRGGPVGRVAVAGLAAAPALAFMARRRPATAVLAGAVGAGALGAGARLSGAGSRDAAALTVLSPVFGVAFGLGLLRGLALAAAAALRRAVT